MWIEASVDSLALLADGVRLLGGGYQGCHVWLLETGDQIATLWNYGSFELAPHEQAIVHASGLDINIHRLDAVPRARLRGRFLGFSRDGTHLIYEAIDRWLHALVVDLDGNYVGRLDVGHMRDGTSQAEIVRAADLRDGWYAVQTTGEVQLRRLGERMQTDVSKARLACTTGDGRFFLTCDEKGVTVVETSTGTTERIDVIATKDLVRADAAGRLLCPYHENRTLHLLVVDHAMGTSRRDFVVGDWPLEQLIAGNGVIAIACGPRQLAFLDVERGRVVEAIELDEDSRVAVDREQATIAIASPTGRFEVWSIEPPALLERDQLPAGPRLVTIGPRHIAIAYDRLVHVRPRP